MTQRFKTVLLASAAAFILSASPSAQTAPADAKDAILILDASGSMWGQIDGINKIVIAKDVVEGLVRGLPAEQRLGMVAYGHRKKGDCSDIETIADVGGSRDAMIKEIRGLSPKGKTPLSKSVEHAANELNYTKKAATVILVSDGLETCDADPCALAKLLEEKGLDFTVHVVGFDVTAQERKGLVCIAEETGGEFLAADNADELTDALTQVAMADVVPVKEPTAKPQTVALKATILKGGPDIQSQLNWRVKNAETGDIVFEKDNTGYADFEVVPGDYVAEAVWTGWPHKSDRYKGDKSGSKAFTIHESRPAVITVPIDLGIEVIFDADKEIAEGNPINVTWSGPDDLGVTISANALDDGPRDAIYFTPGQKGRDAYEKASVKDGVEIDSNGDGTFDQNDMAKTQIGGPSHSGDYEVRYTLNSPRVILARQPLTVTQSDYAIEAPSEIPVASKFTIDVAGPVKTYDMVRIEKPDLKSAYYQGPYAKLKAAGAVEITAPSDPGDYELRYIMSNGYTTYANMQHAVQVRRPIKVVGVEATISGPAKIIGGSMITVDVTAVPGDGWKDDGISIVEPGANKRNRDSATVLGKSDDGGKTITFRTPNIDGEYEIIYILNPGSKVLARQPLTVTRAQASVDAPDTVKLGENFEVKYSGPIYPGDRIIVAPADVPDLKMWGWSANYGFFVKEGETTGTVRGGFKAAVKPGEYVVRYVTGHQHQTLARDTMTVTE